jgi:hypothetical protein
MHGEKRFVDRTDKPLKLKIPHCHFELFQPGSMQQ